MVLLKYKQWDFKPSKVIMSFGMKTWVHQSGVINYDQEEEIEESKVVERIKLLKSYSNRNYHTFTTENLVVSK